jgi:gluconokinase
MAIARDEGGDGSDGTARGHDGSGAHARRGGLATVATTAGHARPRDVRPRAFRVFHARAMIIVLMGVSGSGKTTVGRALASRLGCEFFDADDFHPPENVAKMASGIALTDEDRIPWLDRLAAAMQAVARAGRDAVLACSALKESYRRRLERGIGSVKAGGGGERPAVRFVYLKGDVETIESRLATRSGHYMPASLLASQLAAMEQPEDAMVIDIRQTADAQASQIAAVLRASA